MSRRASRAKLCPTPSKGRHYTEADAIAIGRAKELQLQHAHIPVTPFYVYRCPCLWWHLTSKQYNREGVEHRRCVS